MNVDKDASARLERLARRAEHVVPREELAARLEEGRPLRVKLGVDPTAKDVTLGWAVPLRKLREFQDDGHTAVLVVGDFTARIGDPSGKSETRPRLAEQEVNANAEAIVSQLLDILSEDNLEIRHNSEWLEPMSLSTLLGLTSHFTVAQMLERDDFSKRYTERRPISILEFLYPVLQAYDSVAITADIELGGTDQLFNLLFGRDLQRAHGRAPQIAVTMPLLEGLDGVQKMSQSLGNYVGIRDDPAEMFGKLMSVPDGVVGRYARLAAWLEEEEAAALEARAAAGGPAAGAAKRRVAAAVVGIYHGAPAAAEAEAAFDRQFKQNKPPEEIEERLIPPGAVNGDKVSLPSVLVDCGLASSRGEARRLIAQEGVRVDGATVRGEEIALAALAGAVLQVGKRRFVRLRVPHG